MWIYFYKLLNEIRDRDIMLSDVENLESRWDFDYCRCVKVDIQNNNNYKGIKLKGHTINALERVG